MVCQELEVVQRFLQRDLVPRRAKAEERNSIIQEFNFKRMFSGNKQIPAA